MKTFKEFAKQFEKTNNNRDTAKATNNYIDKAALENYAEITKYFICEESKKVLDYLIQNNNTYMHDFGGDTGMSMNVLDVFMKKPCPKDDRADIWQLLKTIEKKDRLREIPLYLTKSEFEQILSRKIAPDKIFLDFDSEEGRNKIVLRYNNIIYKLVSQYVNKCNCTEEDLFSAGLYGLTIAISDYGKRNKTEVDDEILNAKTFGQYAAFIIRNYILAEIKDRSQTVRIPISAQQREKKVTGSNTKTFSVSGDRRKNDDEDSKSLFDVIGDKTSDNSSINTSELDMLWKEVYKELEKEFDTKIIDMYYSKFGLNNTQELKTKDIATKYGIVSSNVTYYINKINRHIQNTPKILNIMKEILEIMNESDNSTNTIVCDNTITNFL